MNFSAIEKDEREREREVPLILHNVSGKNVFFNASNETFSFVLRLTKRECAWGFSLDILHIPH